MSALRCFITSKAELKRKAIPQTELPRAVRWGGERKGTVRDSLRVMTAASSAAPRSDSGGEEHERCMAAVESALEYCPRVAQLRQAPRPPLRVARPLPLLL